MKFKNTAIGQGKMILANDHYVAIPYDCTALTALATNNIIAEGTIIPSNDANAIGVLLNAVDLTENPNGTIVIHGFIKQTALPTAPTSTAMNALVDRGLAFIDSTGKPQPQTYTMTYDLNGAEGTAVTDSSSPYSYGATVTVKAAPSVTTYPTGTTQFDKWNTKADGTGTSYAAADTFAITGATKLFAIYKA